MASWWEQYKEKLSNFSNEQKRHIEDITGCVPLLLRGLLGTENEIPATAISHFIESAEVQNVRSQLNTFHMNMKIK